MKKGQITDKWDRKPLNDAEINSILSSCTTVEEQYIIILMATTGCRVNEVIRSKLEWFDFINDVVMIPAKRTEEIEHARIIKTAPKTTPKTKVDRLIALDERLKYLAPIFFNDYNGVERSRAWIYTTVKRIAKKAGVKKNVTPHIFRHSFIEKMYNDTSLKSKEIGMLVGHKDGSMVENVYTHGENMDIVKKQKRDLNERI